MMVDLVQQILRRSSELVTSSKPFYDFTKTEIYQERKYLEVYIHRVIDSKYKASKKLKFIIFRILHIFDL